MTYFLRDPVNNNNRGEERDNESQEVKNEVKKGQDEGHNNESHTRNSGDSTNHNTIDHNEISPEIELNHRKPESGDGTTEVKVTDTKVKKNKFEVKTEEKGPLTWWWYEKQEDEEDFELRNKQVCLVIIIH